MIHLRKVKYIKHTNLKDCYPFNVPCIRKLDELEFQSPVTILVGDNGSGKSAFLKTLSLSINAIPITGDYSSTNYLSAEKDLSALLKLTWGIKINKGFFFRADNYVNFINKISNIHQEMNEELVRVEDEYSNKSEYSKKLAKMPFMRSIYELQETYGCDLSENSHGESFLKFFAARLHNKSIYILDEPEVPLSPINQITLMGMIKEAVSNDCQFIIATHSPILMAFPNAEIYDLSGGYLKSCSYEEIESISFLKSFLSDPNRYLRYLE